MIERTLRVLMAERRENIQSVSDATGLSRSTISSLINGAAKGIQFKTLIVLSNHFNVDPEKFFKDVKR